MNSVKPPLKSGVWLDFRFWGRDYDPVNMRLYRYSPIYKEGINNYIRTYFIILPQFALDVKNKL